MNIDDNPAPRKAGFKTSAAIAITTLLVFGAVAGVLVGPAKSAFAATITSSSTQFFGPALERFLITDSSKTNLCDTITVHVKAARGSTSLAESDVTLYNIGTSGQFEMFVTTSNSPFVPANPTYNAAYCAGQTAAPFVVRINQSPVLNNTGATHEVALTISAASVSLKDGDSIIVTYAGQILTVNFAKATVTATTDRATNGNTVGDGGIVLVKLTDPNAVLDPTSIDKIRSDITGNSNPPSVSDTPLTATGGTMNYTGALFIEEGQNSGIFDLPVKVISGAQGAGNPNPVNGATLSGVTFPGSVNFQIQGMQVYNQTLAKPVSASTASPGTWATAPWNSILSNAGVTSSTSVVTQNTDGSVSATATLANGLAVTITDPDQNFDTQSKDFINAASNATSKGSIVITMDGLNAARGAAGNLWINNGTNTNVFQETGFNTGVFQPTLTNQAIPITLVPAGSESIDQSGIHVSPSFIAGNNNIYVQYYDGATVSGGKKAFQSVVTLSHTIGSVSTTTPTVSLNGKFPLTITDPDLNTNKNTIVSFTATFNAAGSSSNTNANQCWNDQQGCLTLKVGGTGITFSNANPLSITFVETAANSGIFTASNVDMGIIQQNANANGQTVTDGTQVEFKYHDQDENPVANSTSTITIGKPPVNISVDRGTVPNPADGLGPVKFTITVTDSTLNTQPNSLQSWLLPGDPNLPAGVTFTVTVTKKDGVSPVQGNVVGLTTGNAGPLAPQTFTETAAGSGVFTFQYVLTGYTGGALSDLDNAKIKFTYGSSAGTTASVSVTMRSYTGVISSSSTAVAPGSNITVTISDPDLTRDNTVLNTAPFTATAQNDQIGNPLSFTATETGLGTGVFTKTLAIGKDIKVADLVNNVFSTQIALKYKDVVASDLSANIIRELDLAVGTTTGNVTITPSIVGPGTTAYIYIKDPDMIQNPAGTDIIGQNSQSLFSITSDATSAITLNSGITAQETSPGSGIFKTKLVFTPASCTSSTACQNYSGQFTTTGLEIDGTALPGDTVAFRYQDQKDATGSKVTISSNFKVQSFDPTFSVDKPNVGAGDSFTVTVTDPDAVKDSTAIDTVTLRAYSTTDPVGTTVSALETGPGTGVFTAPISTTTGVSSGSVSVKTGDQLTIKYNDKYPSDYATRVKTVADPSKDFFYNINIGGISTNSNAISPSQAQAQNLQGQNVPSVTSGSQIVLQSTLVNNQPGPQPYAAIVEVRDSNDITVSLQWQTGTLPQGGSQGIGVSWTPDQPGTYHVRVFVLTNLSNPQVLSPTTTSDIVVS